MADDNRPRKQAATLLAAMSDPGADEPADIDLENMRQRVRAALVYLAESKPGKRFTALVALWRACTGGEAFNEAEALRHYRTLPSALRATIRQLVCGYAELEPSHAGGREFCRVAERFEDLEDKIQPARSRRHR